MNFPETVGVTIKESRERKKLSPTDLSKLLKVTRPTIANWESGKTFPDANMIYQMAQCLDLDPMELLGMKKNKPTYIREDANLLACYHRLSDVNRKSINRMINSMLADQEEERAASLLNDYQIITDEPTPAAAGTGCDYSDEEPSFTFVRRTPVNLKADHLVHISGRSMEPLYQDGDIVYVMKTKEIVSGYDYICDTADGRVIKRAKGGKLFSLNRDLPYSEKFEDDHVMVFGRVLGIMKPGELVSPDDFADVQAAHVDDVRRFRQRMYQIES